MLVCREGLPSTVFDFDITPAVQHKIKLSEEVFTIFKTTAFYHSSCTRRRNILKNRIDKSSIIPNVQNNSEKDKAGSERCLQLLFSKRSGE